MSLLTQSAHGLVDTNTSIQVYEHKCMCNWVFNSTQCLNNAISIGLFVKLVAQVFGYIYLYPGIKYYCTFYR